MTIVDKIMLAKILKFQNEVTTCYNKFDLQGAYKLTKKFLVEEVAEFYLEFAKDRLLVK